MLNIVTLLSIKQQEMDKITIAKELFKEWCDQESEDITPIAQSGSYREYYRLQNNHKTALAVYNPDTKENIAFTEFSKHFSSKKINVPQIYAERHEEKMYLIQDLGNLTLFEILEKNNFEYSTDIINLYKESLKELVKIQITGKEGFDYSHCYPRKKFDKQSIMWDLNYFKYYFLKLIKIQFDEQSIEDDFNCFADYLLQAESNFFMFRDFQARNIMIYETKPYFIDYQGGREGALQYDLASVLFQAKANMPTKIREELLDFYIVEVQKNIHIDSSNFKNDFYAFVLIRTVQVLGAYGFRGFYEGKAHFINSIPYAIENLKYILNKLNLPIEIPELTSSLNEIIEDKSLQEKYTQKPNTLTIQINSFSYKHGIPIDKSGNGGGFVFDCRAIHNPGRYTEYKQLTGRDKPVIDFLDKEIEMKYFITNVYNLAEKSVEKYLERGFSSLIINFGCTGGQHRSVYSAEHLSQHLLNKYKVKIILKHREQKINEEFINN